MGRVKELFQEDWERAHLMDEMYLDDEYRVAEEWQRYEEERKKRLPAIIEIHYGRIDKSVKSACKK